VGSGANRDERAKRMLDFIEGQARTSFALLLYLACRLFISQSRTLHVLQTALKPLLHAALSHCAHACSEPYVPRVAGILESRSTRPGTAVAPTYQRPTPAPSRATAISRTARLAAPLARQSRESACTLHRSSRLSAMGFFKKSEVKKNYEFGKGRSSNQSPSLSPSHHPHPNHDRQGPRQRQLRRGQIGHQDLGQ